MGAALLRIRPRADVYDVGRRGASPRYARRCSAYSAPWHRSWSAALRFVPGGFTLIAAVVCALATAGMVVPVFSPIRTIPASVDWERSEA